MQIDKSKEEMLSSVLRMEDDAFNALQRRTIEQKLALEQLMQEVGRDNSGE